MTTIRTAILRAADHIEQNPGQYDFWSNKVPECGTPGCMLGWIGFFLGVRGWVSRDVCPVIGLLPDSIEFTERRLGPLKIQLGIYGSFQRPEIAVACLRAYADKYHPAESRALIPESVRRIFTMTHAELTRELA